MTPTTTYERRIRRHTRRLFEVLDRLLTVAKELEREHGALKRAAAPKPSLRVVATDEQGGKNGE
jgi:hypothetical protein